MRIGICDADGMFLERMKRELKLFMEEKGMCGQVCCFTDADLLTEYLDSEILDLVFLNVMVEGRSGIEIAKTVGKLQPECSIVFCSDSLEHAIEVYETEHCYYLIRSDMEKYLPRAMERALDIQHRKKGKICIYSCGKNEMISVNEILYVERNGKKSYVHLADGTQAETPEKIGEIEQKLVWPQFSRCHNSFIISFDWMRTYSRYRVVMEDGREIPVSRPYLVRMRKTFFEWNQKNR